MKIYNSFNEMFNDCCGTNYDLSIFNVKVETDVWVPIEALIDQINETNEISEISGRPKITNSKYHKYWGQWINKYVGNGLNNELLTIKPNTKPKEIKHSIFEEFGDNETVPCVKCTITIERKDKLCGKKRDMEDETVLLSKIKEHYIEEREKCGKKFTDQWFWQQLNDILGNDAEKQYRDKIEWLWEDYVEENMSNSSLRRKYINKGLAPPANDRYITGKGNVY